jgi:signal transduction histidine kinase
VVETTMDDNMPQLALDQPGSTSRQFPSSTADIVAALKSISELKGLSEGEYAWIAEHGTERIWTDGDPVFSQGDPPHQLMFILSGEILVHRHSSSPVSVLIGRTGRITGRTPFSRIKAWNADGRALGNVWTLGLRDDLFPEMLRAIPSMTERIVRVLLDRNREYTRAEEQIGKLAALSNLAANLAHELNNPASAARSASTTLTRLLSQEEVTAHYEIGRLLTSEQQLKDYLAWLRTIRDRQADHREHTNRDSTLDANDAEDAILDWLTHKHYQDAWKVAPILAECAITTAELDALTELIPESALTLAIQDLTNIVSRDLATGSIAESTERIFNIVTAMKDYSFMDQQPIQDVDLAKSLDTVLQLFKPRLRNVIVKRSYSSTVPLFRAFGSELNQVWAALIENALDAMGEDGVLKLSTKLQGKTILVEIENNGPEIATEYADRIFEPFFTTKPFGKGLGLGLDLVQRVVKKHFGTVAFDSKPLATVFHVRLPLDRTEVY